MSSCPRIEYKPMNPLIGGRTLFECDGKKCQPYKIEINPLSKFVATIDYFNKMVSYYKTNQIDKFFKKYGFLDDYLKNFENYIITHEIIHYKSLQNHPEKIPRLARKYGSAWRAIEEGITEEKTIEEGYKIGLGDLWKEFSSYEGERNLVKNLAKEDNEIAKYMEDYYDATSCLAS